MTDRQPYSRVYWSIIDDERFANIYDDDRCLAWWLRLLLIADQAWPASGTLPAGIRRTPLGVLVGAGVVEIRGNRFRIHGLDREREGRKRAATRSPTASQPGPSREAVGRSRARAPRLGSSIDTPSSGEGSGERVTPALDAAWETATGRGLLGAGDFAFTYVDDAARRHGEPATVAAVEQARRTFKVIPTPQQLAVAVRAILDPLPSSREVREAEVTEQSRRSTERTLELLHRQGGHAEPHPRCPLCREAA